MAATQGHGNPDWSRDETLLAIHLYQSLAGSIPGPTDPSVIALSETLKALPIHHAAERRDSFRNPAGVAFKLQNIRQAASGRGLKHTSKLDRELWDLYGHRPEEVSRVAEAIVAASSTRELLSREVDAVTEEETFAEGAVLTATHYRRERDPRARKKVLESRLNAGTLRCDCCDAVPRVQHLDLALAAFEVHHTLPLATTGPKQTRISDLALLCAVCHRLIHRAMKLERKWIGVADLKALLSAAPREL